MTTRIKALKGLRGVTFRCIAIIGLGSYFFNALRFSLLLFQTLARAMREGNQLPVYSWYNRHECTLKAGIKEIHFIQKGEYVHTIH
jgi:hypothetical protein